MCTPRDRPESGPSKERRRTFRALDFERIPAIFESARHRGLANSIRPRAAVRELPTDSPTAPDATISDEDAASLISARLDGLAPEPIPREGFDPCRESPWWRLEDRSGP